jgi:hypothetical protein
MITTPAEAIVDPLDADRGERWWRVTVRTPTFWAGRRYRRVYQIKAWTDSLAAREGLERFAQEVDGRPRIIVER